MLQSTGTYRLEIEEGKLHPTSMSKSANALRGGRAGSFFYLYFMIFESFELFMIQWSTCFSMLRRRVSVGGYLS